LLGYNLPSSLVLIGKLRLNSRGWIDTPTVCAILEPLNDNQFSADHR
jgi:hypothetical protein